MDPKEKKSAEAQARAVLAEKLKARDAIRVSLSRAEALRREKHDVVLDLIARRSEIEDERLFDGSDDERLARLRSLIDSGSQIPDSRLASANSAARLARLDEEIEAAQAIVGDLDSLIRKLKDDLEWPEHAAKDAARRVLTPTIHALHDRIAAAQAAIKPQCLLLLRLLKSGEAPPDLSNSLIKVLSGTSRDERLDGFAEWERALAALETDANALLPAI